MQRLNDAVDPQCTVSESENARTPLFQPTHRRRYGRCMKPKPGALSRREVGLAHALRAVERVMEGLTRSGRYQIAVALIA